MLVPAEFNEIVGGSEIIAYARIVDVRPEWADGRRWIDSVVTAEVVLVHEGRIRRDDLVQGAGRQARSISQRRRWRAVFARGDEAVLFLKTHADGLPDVFGLNQGVFRVRVDARTGQRMVVPPPVDASEPSAAEPRARQAWRRSTGVRWPLTRSARGYARRCRRTRKGAK